MTTRRQAALAGAGSLMLALALAGCTTASTPSPSATATPVSAAEKCTPQSGTIQWYPALYKLDNSEKGKHFAAVRVTTVDFSADADNPSERSINVSPRDHVQYDGDSKTPSSPVEDAAWKKTLVSSLRLTGQVPPYFGIPQSLPDDSTFVSGHSGKYVVVDEEGFQVVPFSIRCGKDSPVFGKVSGISNYNLVVPVVKCDQINSGKGDGYYTVAVKAARPYCTPTS